ncbi:MAG: BamA/TamA family outer membrane protein, partial [Pirellulales bacterium]
MSSLSRTSPRWAGVLACAGILWLLAAPCARAQMSAGAPGGLNPTGPPEKPKWTGPEVVVVQPGPDHPMVVDVRVEGHHATSVERIRPHVRTRKGRPLDQNMVEEDVRRLHASKLFLDVRPVVRPVQGGVVVSFQVLERSLIKHIRYVGNKHVVGRKLNKQAAIKRGDALDPYIVEDARSRIEAWYREKGHTQCTVKTLEGDKPGDQGVTFLVNEGPLQKVSSVSFEGNTVAPDGRMQVLCQTKPPLLRIPGVFRGIKGFVDPMKIDHDLDELTSYYRRLGYFQARVGRELEFDRDQRWAHVRFVIHEGIRYRVRDVAILGNTKFSTEQLREPFKLDNGEYFDQVRMQHDVTSMEETYGGRGYVFATIEPETRFLEEPGLVDLVYKISEGARCRVGQINVHIQGDDPHTRRMAVLNRVSLRPGDILDIRELRDSERRLKASGIFTTEQQPGGTQPKIVFSAPTPGEEGGEMIAENPDGPQPPPGQFRGQSPDDLPSLAAPQAARGRPRTWEAMLDQTMVDADDELAIVHVLADGSIEFERLPRQTAQSVATSAASYGPSASSPAATNRAAAISLPAHGGHSARQVPAPGPQRPIDTPPRSLPSHNVGRPIVRGQNVWPDGGTAPRSAQPVAGHRYARVPAPATSPAQPPPADAARPANVAPQRNQYPAPPSGAQRPIIRGQDYGYSAGQGEEMPSFDMNQVPATRPQAGGLRQTPPPVAAPAPFVAPAPRPVANPAPVAPYVPPGPRYIPGPQAVPPQAQAIAGPTSPPTSGNGPPAWLSGGTTQPPAGLAAPGVLPPPQGYNGPGELFPGLGPPAPGPLDDPTSLIGEPTIEVPIDIYVEETQTGRLMLGAGVNSNAGLVGQLTLDEQNFDWRRWPRSWSEIRNGQAWRGGGQHFRIEAMPGTQVQRYMVSFTEPYLFDTQNSLGLSGFFYQRFFQNWTEERLGGRISVGRQLAPDLAVAMALRMENVNISNPRPLPAPQSLIDVLGNNGLYTARWSLTHDTRDHPFLPTSGHRIMMAYEQAFGTFSFPRGELEASQYFLLRQRADGTGRHTLALITMLGFTGSDTPIFENFFAGGYGTLRGFYFRGASPVDMGTIVGGRFQWINTVEYMFPIKADDAIKGVVFCDFGTVETVTQLKGENYRVAPGLGLRLAIPMMGPAPIALDFAVPVHHAPGDRQ